MATITVDTTVGFQVMGGWEATGQAGHEEPGYLGWQAALLDAASGDLGINRVRVEARSGMENSIDHYAEKVAGRGDWRAVRYQMVNDNADPNLINPAGFHFSDLDLRMDLVVVPLRQRLAARGEHLYVSLDYVSFTGATGNVHLQPAEYAEFMLAVFTHLQGRYGFVPDAIEAILEPDNATAWRGPSIGAAIVAAGARLAAAGFRPDFIAPSVTNAGNAVPWLNQIVAVPGALTYLKEVSYHRYGGATDANLSAIGSRAGQLGLRTAMLEHIGSGVEDLYKDLTLANASSWQQYTLAYPTTDNGAQYYTITGGHPVIGSRTRDLRQYFRYVRAGAYRVGATSDQSIARSVAFTNVGGGPVVVLHLSGGGTFSIRGLRPGRYGVSSSANSAELGEATSGANGELRVALSGPGVYTVYSKP